MRISSILFSEENLAEPGASISEESARDLRIDQVLSRLSSWHQELVVQETFCTPLTDPAVIRFRQQIMVDFRDHSLQEAAGSFAKALRTLLAELKDLRRAGLPSKDLLDCGRYLQLADDYCSAVCTMADTERTEVHSVGLRRFFRELQDYRTSELFCRLQRQIADQFQRLERVHFCMLLKDGRVRIRPYGGEERLDVQLEALFARFRQNIAEMEPMKRPELCNVHHVDAEILELLTHWYPQEMDGLRAFPAEWPDFIDTGLERFSEEVWFYLDWLRLIEPLQRNGLSFCCPKIAACEKALCCRDGFDLALALELYSRDEQTVPNSFSMEGEERILIVTGPNQGGKTTFARFFGQTFYWASLGCLIPGSSAVLRCFDGLFTHFNREETLDTLNGKLQNELERLHDITERATENSVVVINEIFASTTLSDAVYLGKHMLQELIRLGCASLCVTFLDELAEDSRHTVSMMSTVNPDGSRCFRIIRKQADGLAYAMQLAQKHQLDYKSLTRRLEQ